MWKCNYCDKEFENSKIGANHIRWHHKDKKFSEEGYKKILENAEKTNSKFGKKITIKKNCYWCNNEFTIRVREFSNKQHKKCCLRTCSAKYSQSFSDPLEISKAIKNIYTNNPNHAMCNTWKLSIDKKNFSSKNERLIRDYIKNKYKDDEWTFGPLVKFNGVNLVCDLYSHKLKVIFEYDGIWHFKDIKGQLADKQNKDLSLEKWSIENKYRLIRIKEEVFKSNKEKWLKTIEEEIYNGKQSIVKFY